MRRRHQNTQTNQEHRNFLLRPPDRNVKQKIRDIFWNPTNKTCLTRTPLNWFMITIYYTIFIGIVIAIFTSTMFIVYYKVNTDKPQYILGDSFVGRNPVLNFFPVDGPRSLIWLSSSRSYEHYVDSIKKIFDDYQKANGDFDPTKFGECGTAPFGYDKQTPCIYLRVNRLIQWKPMPYESTDDLPSDAPKDVVEAVSGGSQKLWVSCQGAAAKDRDHIESSFFSYQGDRGFDVEKFPFDMQNDFVDPIVALKLIGNQTNRLFTFTCSVWGKEINSVTTGVDVGMSVVPTLRKKQRLLSETEKKILKEAFELFDSDNDGYLDYYEFKATSRCLGFQMKKSEILVILETYARNNKNLICYEDFFEVMEEKMLKRDPLDEIKEAFRVIANEKTNAITFRDLKLAVEKVGADIPDRDLRSMIEEFDTKGDGKLDEEDFISLIKGESF